LDETEQMIKVIPTVRAGTLPFGPKAKIITVVEALPRDPGPLIKTRALIKTRPVMPRPTIRIAPRPPRPRRRSGDHHARGGSCCSV
jgi:hypothetical protein